MLPIQTPKFNGDGITMLVMSRHEDVIGNVVQAIQNQHVWHHQGLAQTIWLWCNYRTLESHHFGYLHIYIYTAQNSIVLMTTHISFKAKSLIWFVFLIQQFSQIYHTDMLQKTFIYLGFLKRRDGKKFYVNHIFGGFIW